MTLGYSKGIDKLCLELQYGDSGSPTYLRYTRWDSSVTIDSNSYTPARKIDVILPVDRGEATDTEATIVLEADSDALTTALAAGSPHSPILATVYQLVDSVDGMESTTLTLFKGRVVTTVANYRGERDVLALRVASFKHLLQTPMGFQCNPQCLWVFAGTGCPVDGSGLGQTGTLTIVSRAQVTISGVSATPYDTGLSTDRYWHRGYVERDGLRINIREWKNAEATTFHLARVPPASWAGQTVTVFPGCDKSLATCQDRWDAEEGFGGLGFAMPAYKPQFENAPNG
jgi:hypothetical protein